jgi:hypothetical protein
MSRPFLGAPVDRQCIPVSDLQLNQPVHPLAQFVVALLSHVGMFDVRELLG